ncbi:hypothetical protein IW261DRAFT_1423535 [Armillaria novae-zelandiae]|uniref:Uncharacterized protein n=1 Tax=Armillaria novae-zelandiae TaxID=153914 RepID=A0AA39NXD1_9AGAR|nr:hypothetical protein IW261DRAFT_1423535 [Armillaria novae-zelandiae]
MAHTNKPFNPVHNIAYSAGKPSGQSKGPKYSFMLGQDRKPVLCLVNYSTCQGIQICPFVSDDIKITSHTEGSRVALQLQLDQRHAGRAYFTAKEDILNKTIAWFRFIIDNSCRYNLQEATEYNEQEQAIKDHIQLTSTKAKWGQKTKKTCQGRIIIREQSYICCKHYRSFSCKHFVLYPACGGGYNFEYFKIKLQARQQGYGPLMSCTTVHNISSVKVNCDSQHFQKRMGIELQVKELCPAVEEPTVAHLHPSLANLDHIALYIHTEIKVTLPHGTGWDGVAHMKRIQDEEEGTPYIQWDEADESDDEEGPLSGSDDDCFWLIICMLLEHSQDFLQAKWVQCVISFKCVPGWNELELCDRTWVRILSTSICTLLLLRSIKGYCTGQLTNIADRLKDITGEMGKEWRDLHEPGRSLYSLGVYEHLH